MRKYTIHHQPGAQLTFYDRQMLGKDWNDRIRHGKMPTLRGFAKDHGIAFETWRREYERGRMGETVPDPDHPGRKVYALYDPNKAQDNVNAGHANKGAPMKVTNRMAEKFAHWVRDGKLSPYDARCRLAEDPEFKGRRIPCVRTWYKHLAVGDLPVKYGETPYHPDRRRRKGARPHPAKTVLTHLQMADRPKEATERSELGHFEMDTVVSSMNGTGGLLTLIDRCSRRYFIEKINSISQGEIIRALRRLRKRHEFRQVKSITTDNGCEFLDDAAIKAVVGCDVFYTHAYASYEKGSVENCNRIVRRWYPKGTDFALVTRADVSKLEKTINGIHRLSLGGKTATQYDEELARAA